MCPRQVTILVRNWTVILNAQRDASHPLACCVRGKGTAAGLGEQQSLATSSTSGVTPPQQPSKDRGGNNEHVGHPRHKPRPEHPRCSTQTRSVSHESKGPESELPQKHASQRLADRFEGARAHPAQVNVGGVSPRSDRRLWRCSHCSFFQQSVTACPTAVSSRGVGVLGL